jgi:hypothetical protein
MAAPERILPGFLTPHGAAALQAGLEQAEETRRDLERDPRDWDDEFPAKITAWDETEGRASWTRQTYDSDGRRIDDPLGVTGSPSYMPAYPVGNGLMPPPSFPVEVWMRRRVVNATLGPVYEFDWQCACDEDFGSGSL